jgi:transcriptional regulator with XRE-family HTH domain
MAIRESAGARGSRRSRLLVSRTAAALADARRASGLSQREVARQVGIDHRRIARAERGDPTILTIDLAARMGAVLGLQAAVALHPDGEPVRDAGHLALIGRLLDRLGGRTPARLEVPVPIEGDRRSADIVLDIDRAKGVEAIVEAETHIDDVQRIERSMAAKQRDLGISRAILLVADTRHNRSVMRDHPGIRARFPVDTRTCLAALRDGRDPGGDCLVIL